MVRELQFSKKKSCRRKAANPICIRQKDYSKKSFPQEEAF